MNRNLEELRVAVGGIIHETHTFAPTPTSLPDFEQTWHSSATLIEAMQGTSSGIGGMIEGITPPFPVVPAILRQRHCPDRP